MDQDRQAQLIQQEIETLLRQKIGLNPESVGSRSIVRAVKKGMRNGKMQGLADYASSLRTSPSLLDALIESIVVPETSFFRNRASFVFLRQWVAQEWLQNGPLKRPPARALRVLSIPCSTGEEPYSIAITLLEEGLGLEDFHIDGVDVSAVALEKARQGIYSPYAFRRQIYRSDDKYFTLGIPEGATGNRGTQRYFLIDSVREKVSFIRGNILDPQMLIDQPAYDVVFCRNLLIYFDQSARDRTLAFLNRALRPGGLLFVGYAETSLIDPHLYHPVPYPQTFAYRKQPIQPPEPPRRRSHPLPPAKRPALFCGPAAATPSSKPMAAPPQPPSLAKAQALADQGEVQQAIQLCDRYLQQHPADPNAHLLRGELHQATGHEAAAQEHFEKALYLNPNLREALIHLLLIKEENLDFAGAALIRARLGRLADAPPI